jgi:hypothetical protein
MKRALTLALGLILSACSALPAAPTPTAAPTWTPVVVVQTVVVTVIPTQAPTQPPTPTPGPTVTAIPSPTTAPAAAAPAAAAQAPTSAPAAGESPTATLPANAGGDLFTNLTRGGDHFALKCLPETITFGVHTDNFYVTEVDVYYRIEDRLSVSISNWHNAGAMTSDKNGNFTIDLPASAVDPDLRSHRAWFDYQFVGVNKVGDAVGRSAKIVKQITYTIDCSD